MSRPRRGSEACPRRPLELADTPMPWTGPLASDLRNGIDDQLLHTVPPHRWPYGPPDHHEACCGLHSRGLYCDCAASDADDTEHGIAATPPRRIP